MASDLISRKEFIKKFCGEQCGCTREECGYEYVEDGHDACFIIEEIEKAPAVDAVEVVRCKDCTFNGCIPAPIGYCYCSRTDSIAKDNDFCSYGAKGDGGKQDD